MLIVDRNISFSDYSSAVNSCLAFLFTKDLFPHCSLVLQQSQGHTSFLVLFWILPQWLLCFTDCYHQSHKRAIGHAAFQPFGSREYSVLLSSISICNQCTIFFLLSISSGSWKAFDYLSNIFWSVESPLKVLATREFCNTDFLLCLSDRKNIYLFTIH